MYVCTLHLYYFVVRFGIISYAHFAHQIFCLLIRESNEINGLMMYLYYRCYHYYYYELYLVFCTGAAVSRCRDFVLLPRPI